MVIFDQHGIVKTETVIDASATDNGISFQRAQTWRRLARIGDLRACTRNQVDERARCGRNTGEMREEIERGSLAGQNRTRWSVECRDPLARLNPIGVTTVDADLYASIEDRKCAQRDAEPGKDSAFPCDDRPTCGALRPNDCFAREIAGAADVFEQRSPNDRFGNQLKRRCEVA